MTKEYEFTGKAMGTEYSVAIIGNSESTANEMFKITSKIIAEYEAKFSRFLPTSELSLLNEKKEMAVSRELLDVILEAYQLFSQTHGIFNPLVQVARFGYNKTFDELKNSDQENIPVDDESQYDIDFSTTVIDLENSHVTLREGQKLDFGGFLKGYLAEKIAKKLMSDFPQTTGIIINLGGDIHTQGLDEHGNKFIFNIYNPILDNEDITIPLFNQSLATSGTYKRKWLRGGIETNHLLDASGAQNFDTDIVSASIIHESGAVAESYAKVFLALGNLNAIRLLNNKELSFITVDTQGEVIRNIL